MSLHASLLLHPECRCALKGIQVEIVRLKPKRLLLRFSVTGDSRHIRWPEEASPPARQDEMWQTTCFEAFVRAEGEDGYYEVNMLPGLNWAAYRFSHYREGKIDAQDVDPPHLDSLHQPPSPGHLFGLTLELENTPLPLERSWWLGISAVIEEKSGRKSYWALTHPPGKPDFHHPDCFALELGAARPA